MFNVLKFFSFFLIIFSKILLTISFTIPFFFWPGLLIFLFYFLILIIISYKSDWVKIINYLYILNQKSSKLKDLIILLTIILTLLNFEITIMSILDNNCYTAYCMEVEEQETSQPEQLKKEKNQNPDEVIIILDSSGKAHPTHFIINGTLFYDEELTRYNKVNVGVPLPRIQPEIINPIMPTIGEHLNQFPDFESEVTTMETITTITEFNINHGIISNEQNIEIINQENEELLPFEPVIEPTTVVEEKKKTRNNFFRRRYRIK